MDYNSQNSQGGEQRRPRQRFRTNGPSYERTNSYSDRPRFDAERPRFDAERPRRDFNRPRFDSERPRFNNDRPRFRQEGEERQQGGFTPRPRFRQEGEEHQQGSFTPRPRFRQEGDNRQQQNSFGQNRSFNKQRTRTSAPDAKYSARKRQEYKEKYEDPTKPIRLNKFLANAGICSRREADDFIQAGVITVNGQVVCELGAKVLPTDQVKFHEQPVRREKKVYILLNKPKNTVTTTDDPQERHTVIDIVKHACAERIYPVGRLDRNTTGVLLLTNDGDLAAKLTHPKFGKKKLYAATLDKDLSEEAYEEIMSGIILDDETIIPDALAFPKEGDRKHVGIQIHSGQNRVVRRIFEKVGYKVQQLDRVSFAGLTKKNVPRGKYRYLTQDEVNMLQMGAFE